MQWIDLIPIRAICWNTPTKSEVKMYGTPGGGSSPPAKVPVGDHLAHHSMTCEHSAMTETAPSCSLSSLRTRCPS
ncbi:MAG: hypothetical protein LBF05_06115 [Tannerella sp.]|jgi:hypothetical protein|nr:hypothetical protein [Tannerella sp.]